MKLKSRLCAISKALCSRWLAPVLAKQRCLCAVSLTCSVFTRYNLPTLLLITFSKKAAEEMRERLTSMPGLDASMTNAMQVRTFHAFCLRLLRMNGLQQEILSDGRYQQIVFKRIMLGMGLQDTYQPEVLISLLSSYKMQLIEVEDLPEGTEEEKEVKRIFLQYEQWKMEQQKIDFDDILIKAYHLLQQNADILRSLQRKFTYISVDEFQDTNTVQYEIIKMIAKNHENLMVVGDDDQTIYSFNGARNEFILQFHEQYPAATDRYCWILIIVLRRASSVWGMRLSNTTCSGNRRPFLQRKKVTPKPQYVKPANSDDEADWLINDLRIKVAEGGSQYGDFAILYRTASNSRAIIEQLILHNLPFVDYGSNDSFYDQWMVKPIIDHLRLAHERRNFEAIEGVLPSLYIGRDQGMRIIQDQEAIQAKKWPLIHLLGLPQLKGFSERQAESPHPSDQIACGHDAAGCDSGDSQGFLRCVSGDEQAQQAHAASRDAERNAGRAGVFCQTVQYGGAISLFYP